MRIKSLIDYCKEDVDDNVFNEPKYKTVDKMSFEDFTLFFESARAENRLEENGIDPEIKNTFMFRVFKNRLEAYAPDVICGNAPFVFLVCLCKTPAEAVMWAYTLKHMSILEHGEKITIKTLTKYFPTGFPKESTMHSCWDNQKGRANGVDGDNLLDYPEYWKFEDLKVS